MPSKLDWPVCIALMAILFAGIPYAFNIGKAYGQLKAEQEIRHIATEKARELCGLKRDAI